MIGLIIGLLIGGTVGFMTCALCTISKIADIEAEVDLKDMEKRL